MIKVLKGLTVMRVMVEVHIEQRLLVVLYHALSNNEHALAIVTISHTRTERLARLQN